MALQMHVCLPEQNYSGFTLSPSSLSSSRVKELRAGGASSVAMAAPKQSDVLRPDKPVDPSDLQYLHLSLQKVMNNTVAMNKTCRVVLSVQDLLPGYCI